MSADALALLRRPFPSNQISHRPVILCVSCGGGNCVEHATVDCATCGRRVSAAHADVPYVGHARLNKRLNEADPRWYWEPFAVDAAGLPALRNDRPGNVGLWLRLYVHPAPDAAPICKPGYGTAASGPDEIKEVIGDALRNAAMRFGAALDLWLTAGPDRSPVAGRPGLPTGPAGDPRAPAWEFIRLASARRGRADNAQIADDFETWAGGTGSLAVADLATLEGYTCALLQEPAR